MSFPEKDIEVGHRERYYFARSRAKGYILDAACGCGYGSKILESAGIVTGIDLEQEAIDFAEKHYPGPTYLLHDVCQPLEVAFDWVVSLETIEHLKEPEKALEHFRQSANLVISTPDQDQYKFREDSYAGNRFPHIRHYTGAELEELLNRCGWSVVEKHCQINKSSAVTLGGGGMFHVWVCR